MMHWPCKEARAKLVAPDPRYLQPVLRRSRLSRHTWVLYIYIYEPLAFTPIYRVLALENGITRLIAIEERNIIVRYTADSARFGTAFFVSLRTEQCVFRRKSVLPGWFSRRKWCMMQNRGKNICLAVVRVNAREGVIDFFDWFWMLSNGGFVVVGDEVRERGAGDEGKFT